MEISKFGESLFKQMERQVKLIQQGVDNRTALEVVFGKETADYSYKILAEIENKEYKPNTNQN